MTNMHNHQRHTEKWARSCPHISVGLYIITWGGALTFVPHPPCHTGLDPPVASYRPACLLSSKDISSIRAIIKDSRSHKHHTNPSAFHQPFPPIIVSHLILSPGVHAALRSNTLQLAILPLPPWRARAPAPAPPWSTAPPSHNTHNADVQLCTGL